MEYINPPLTPLANFTHHTFFSSCYGHDLGYMVYLPDGYETSNERYPVFYHLHGWTNNEASDCAVMEDICRSRNAVTVFPNCSPVIEDRNDLPVEDMLFQEFIPFIEKTYRVQPKRGISGFSMGAGMAMYYACKYPALFASVTAYAGTYHHYFYYTDFRTVGAAPECAAAFYDDLISSDVPVSRDLLLLAEKNREPLKQMQITLHIGNKDVLYCDNEIFRLHLKKLDIPHVYKVFDGAEHKLVQIL